MRSLEQLLPETSFVSFRAKKLSHPTLNWVNPAIPPVIADDEPLYCLPYPGEPPETYMEDEVMLLAERYGGDGVGRNGGGVRCGLRNGVQIKGVGKNPLAGTESDFWHSHGGNSLELAYREAIWGEICNIALPYGGARVHAIVETGTQIQYLAHDGKREAKRALVFRQALIRPAHFTRAIFFSPDEKIKRSIVSDAIRTSNSVHRLPDIFNFVLADRDESVGGDNSVTNSFLAMAGRFARQLASSRAKKIMHGGLCSSNIALDGTWLDFDTITTISDYGRVIMGGFDLPDFWGDHKELVQVIGELCTYVRKYSPASLKLDANDINRHFIDKLQIAEALEFAKLSGIPECVLVSCERDVLSSFYKVIKKIINSGNETPFYFSPRHVWEMPHTMGDFNLNEIFKIASLSSCKEQLDVNISSVLNNRYIAAEFCDRYWSLREQFHQRYPGSNGHFFLVMNASRLNETMPELYRKNLDENIELICRDELDKGNYFERLFAKSKFVYSEVDEEITDLTFFDLLGGVVCPRQGLILNESRVPLSASRALFENFLPMSTWEAIGESE